MVLRTLAPRSKRRQSVACESTYSHHPNHQDTISPTDDCFETPSPCMPHIHLRQKQTQRVPRNFRVKRRQGHGRQPIEHRGSSRKGVGQRLDQGRQGYFVDVSESGGRTHAYNRLSNSPFIDQDYTSRRHFFVLGIVSVSDMQLHTNHVDTTAM